MDVSEEEFDVFVRSRSARLLETAYLISGDRGRAEDLLQLALERTYRRWASIRRRDAPEVYVRRVLVNLNVSAWRGHRLPERLTPSVPEEQESRNAEADYDDRDELWRAIQNLPPRMRATLVLRYFEDLSEAETADVLGCSVGSVKTQTSRALRRLRTQLQSSSSLAVGGSK